MIVNLFVPELEVVSRLSGARRVCNKKETNDSGQPSGSARQMYLVPKEPRWKLFAPCPCIQGEGEWLFDDAGPHIQELGCRIARKPQTTCGDGRKANITRVLCKCGPLAVHTIQWHQLSHAKANGFYIRQMLIASCTTISRQVRSFDCERCGVGAGGVGFQPWPPDPSRGHQTQAIRFASPGARRQLVSSREASIPHRYMSHQMRQY